MHESLADETYNQVEIRRVKKYLVDNIQKTLEEKCGLSFEESKVADIVFAFNNRRMLELLIKRGKYLNNANMEKAEKVEKQMTKLKDEKYEELIIPNSFFCTF